MWNDRVKKFTEPKVEKSLPANWTEQGFVRYVHDRGLESNSLAESQLAFTTVQVVVHKLVSKPDSESRLRQAIETNRGTSS